MSAEIGRSPPATPVFDCRVTGADGGFWAGMSLSTLRVKVLQHGVDRAFADEPTGSGDRSGDEAGACLVSGVVGERTSCLKDIPPRTRTIRRPVIHERLQEVGVQCGRGYKHKKGIR